MTKTIENVIGLYLSKIQEIYSSHLIKVILYGSYAREIFLQI